MTDVDIDPRDGIGGNFPPEPITGPLDAEALRARLLREYEPQLARFSELELGSKNVKAVIATDSDDATVMDFLNGQAKAAVTVVRKVHDAEARRYLDCIGVIHTVFLRRIEAFEAAVIKPIERRHADFMLRKRERQRAAEAEQRRKAAEEAAARAAEAERLRQEAQKKEAARQRRAATDLLHQAEQAQEEANRQAQIAAAPGAPVHAHGNLTPSTSWIQEEWDYEVEDPAIVPEGLKMIDDSAVRAWIKRGIREISGIRIFPVDKVRNRRC